MWTSWCAMQIRSCRGRDSDGASGGERDIECDQLRAALPGVCVHQDGQVAGAWICDGERDGGVVRVFGLLSVISLHVRGAVDAGHACPALAAIYLPGDSVSAFAAGDGDVADDLFDAAQ